jgi:hypothetical protein
MWAEQQRGALRGAPRSPQRTRISCYAAPDKTACAAFFKESRIEFDNATNLDRKSGVRGMKKTGRPGFPVRGTTHVRVCGFL